MEGLDGMLPVSTLIHLQIHIDADPMLHATWELFVIQNLGPFYKISHVYLSRIENTSYLRVWKHLTLSTHHKTYFLAGKTLKNSISREMLDVWHGGMACSKEEVGKNTEAGLQGLEE